MPETPKTNVVFTTGTVGRLIIRGTNIRLRDGVKEWLEKCHKENALLIVRSFAHSETFAALYFEFITPELLCGGTNLSSGAMPNDDLDDESGDFQGDFSLGDQGQLVGLFSEECFSPEGDFSEWAQTYCGTGNCFVIHFLRIVKNADDDDYFVDITLLDPEQSKKVHGTQLGERDSGLPPGAV